MSALESVRLAQAKIGCVRELLLTPTVQSLDRCLDELGETAGLLNTIIQEGTEGGGALPPEIALAAREIRDSARNLRLQIGYASQFWLGWMQIRLGSGYTAEGSPVLAGGESRGSFEV